jgi:hypothetical protein
MPGCEAAEGTLFRPHHVLFFAALRCIAESAEVPISRILFPVFTLVLAPGPRSPRNPFRTFCYTAFCFHDKAVLTFPPSANNDPSPEQYVNNCSHVHLFGA